MNYTYKEKIQKISEPEKVGERKVWDDVIKNTIDTNSPCKRYGSLNSLDWMHVIRNVFPASKTVNWILSKIHRVPAREYKNTLYNILTGYGHYDPPGELTVPQGCYFNPYVRGMVTPVAPFLKDGMLKFDDGVKASIPQMAYDLTEFLSFLQYGRMPDLKIDILT